MVGVVDVDDVVDEAASTACPSDALRFFFDDSPVCVDILIS